MNSPKKMSFAGRVARTGLCGLLLAGLAACVEPQATAAVRAIQLPEPLVRAAIDFALAQQITTECSAEFRMNPAAEADVVVGLAKSNPELADFTEAEIKAATRTKAVNLRVQNEILAYVAKRKILISDRKSWCEAGRFETANKTAIGAHLTQK